MLDLFPSREAGPFGRRLKRERGPRIPVTVVTGFLGAGKTTLIRRFLASPEGQGTAVIVNEFGAVASTTRSCAAPPKRRYCSAMAASAALPEPICNWRCAGS
jgi:hypothetical protein